MASEITSHSNRRGLFFPGRVSRAFLQTFSKNPASVRILVLRAVIAVLLVAFVTGGDALLGSYKHYSRIVDARLAGGYLTSRPGLYAAPRTIRVGQGFTPEELLNVLRRAGYVAKGSSGVWSGTFRFNNDGETIDLRPQPSNRVSHPRLVRISFENGKISELTGDGITLDAFTLEPEILTNDLSSKAGKREIVAYSEIPQVLVHAILAIEDHRFFDHSGLDVFGLTRALLRNAGDERIGQGGSTITQQLVKNTYLSPERTFRRKYAEAMLAFALERRLSKEDIFALYCNEVYLGQRGAVAARGVSQAAIIYFGKELKDLSLGEAATIAGMIQSPARYSPERHREAAEARRNAVLAGMQRNGWVSQEQAQAAAGELLAVVSRMDSNQSLAPYFIDYVNRTVESEFDVSGLTGQIHTTIDLDLQKVAETAIKNQLDRLDSTYKHRGVKPQAALVAIDPSTGNVLAMVGGRNYGESQLNRATDARRQPGSTFKPFVYAAALEDGLSPVQMFRDAPRDFVYDRNRIYRPANYGGGYSMHEVMMRTGLVKSLNVVTVEVAMRTGLARIANLAAQFGLPRPERYPALALGTTEVTPLQLGAAYAAFVNAGRSVHPRVIAGIAELDAVQASNSNAQLVSPTTAYMITNMLSDVVDHGTGRAARGAVKGAAIAGKTGTSHDGWFVGYTPNLVCVVWIGFDDNSQLGLTGAAAALPAWTEFVQGAVALRPELGGRTFECPEGIKFIEIDQENGLRSNLYCPNRELIAVTDRLAPNFECYNHGNLPESVGEREQRVHSVSDITTLARQGKPASKTPFPALDLRTSQLTRIDVDVRGKRTLTNEMR